MQRTGCTDRHEMRIMLPLRVSINHRFLVTEDSQPFFWLGDTAWRLSILAPDEVDAYMENRVRHTFNVIQVHPGFEHPDYAGNLPFLDGDPDRPNEAFWKHLDDILTKARARALRRAGAHVRPGVCQGVRSRCGESSRVRSVDREALRKPHPRRVGRQRRV